jgi:predicted helicase
MADISDKDVERLRSIKSLPSLIKYLRDELGWDVPTDDIEALTFDYSPEELGIDPKTAAKIQEIKRLRPLSPQQPWGIFFVKFEPKRLPVVVLRKILANVAIKKRASSRKSDQASWDCDDLLFVSNYGEGEDRQISFAHFSQDVDRKRPPVLKVLGWDSQNTNLRYQETIRSLRERLSWREEYSKNIELWRKDWRSAFRLQHRQTINDSKKLASQLAELARSIRGEIKEVLKIETEQGPLRQIMESFRESLIHDIDEDQFADMYAQTISYGLLSSRMVDPEAKGTDDFASHMRTNPFLRELMETFIEVGGRKKKGKATIDFDDLGVNDVIEMLDDVDMKAVLLDFGDRNPQEDPVIHFFEGFLQEYDKKAKKDRGVFYTPRPVVSFIVRSVDELLRTEFGLEDGLADTTTWGAMAGRIDDLEIPEGATEDQAFVQILDPATGTGTFLVEVIDLIHKTMTARWQAEGHGKKKIEELWNAYLPKHLLPRLHGYELMMAPYAIAHMKIGLKLYETGYRFESDERARVYLTNALEPAQDFSGTLAFAIPALAHEAEAVNAIKKHQHFTVVVGNPPYSSSSRNTSAWAMELIEPYKATVRARETQIQALSDDYVKFIGLSQHHVEASACGVSGLITNNNYLSGTTFRDMRSRILESFDIVRVLDLHGNSRTKERGPDGGNDENVFDILAGVAVSIFSQTSCARGLRERADIFGTRQAKHRRLVEPTGLAIEYVAISPAPPQFELRLSARGLDAEYQAMAYLPEVFGTGNYQHDKTKLYGSGFKTQQDQFAITFSRQEVIDNVNHLLAPLTTEPDLRSLFTMCSTSQWDFERARTELGRLDWEKLTIGCQYRPFDYRFTIFHRSVVSNPRSKVMGQFLQDNLGLCVGRQGQVLPGQWGVVFCTSFPQDQNLFYRGGNTVFPLYLYGDRSEFGFDSRRHNLSGGFLAELGARLCRDLDGETGLPSEMDPEDVFGYLYAILHSRSYRTRYSQYLEVDFPRIPLPGGSALFSALASLGRSLVSLHLLEAVDLDSQGATMRGSSSQVVEKVSYSEETVWIDSAKTRGFKGVPEEVWNFHIGGYQVCEKWLKDRQAKGGKNPRPGRVLTDEDIEHYQKIVVALSETIRIQAEIDEVIEAHGGWPGAFQTGEVSELADQPDPEDSQASLL